MAAAEALAASKAKLLVAGLVVVGGGGAAAYAATGGFAAGGAALADTVPDGVDAVVYADTDVARDPATSTLVDGYINVTKQVDPDYDGPDSYLELVLGGTGGGNISAGGLNEAIAYTRYPSGAVGGMSAASAAEYVGVVVDADWSEEELAGQLPADAERRTYEGYTVYVARTDGNGSDGADTPSLWVGVLDDGEYVLGTANATTDALDTARGARDAFGGALRTAYDDTRSDGYLRFAATMPAERLPDGRQYDALRGVETVAGAYYTEGEDIGVETRMTAGSASDAEDLESIAEGTLASASQLASSEAVAAVVDSVTVERDGSTVTVTAQMPAEDVVEAYRAAVDGLLGGVGGLSVGSPSVSGPVAAGEAVPSA